MSKPPFKTKYTIKIQAQDNGDPTLTSEAVVLVKLASNKAPIVETKNVGFEVEEGINIGTTVGIVKATDPEDNRISYSIINANQG